MYRKILIALIIIVLLILGGLIAFSNNTNTSTDTQINFLSNKTLKNGDSIEFQLTDSKGNALADQDLKIKFTSATGESQNFTITTDSQGKGYLVLNEQDDGNYTIVVTYDGDKTHKGCSANQSITIGEVETSEYSGDASSDSSQYSSSASSYSSGDSSSSSSDLTYDSELNVYYDSDGIVRGGQADGQSYDYIKNNPPNME